MNAPHDPPPGSVNAMTGNVDLSAYTYEELHDLLQGSPGATHGVAAAWQDLYTSLNELSAALSSHQVSLLSNSGWSGPAAAQFDAYMTAMTQQVKSTADSAAIMSTELATVADAVDNARSQVPASALTDILNGNISAEELAESARPHVQAVVDAYNRANANLVRAQSVAPTVAPSTRDPGLPTTGGTGGTGPSGTVRPTARVPSEGEVPISSGPATGGRSPYHSSSPLAVVPPGGPDTAPTLTAGGAPSGAAPTSGSTQSPGGAATGPGGGADVSAGWWPGLPGGTARNPRNAGDGPDTATRGRARPSDAEFGDGTDGVHGGTRVPSSFTGRGAGNARGRARALGEMEPGIFGGEPVGGGRVIGRSGFGRPSVGTGPDEGITGGRLEASPVHEEPAGPRPRVGSAPEGEEVRGGLPGGMPGMGGGAGREKERGKRPKYLKQDPAYWQSKQDVVPPVID